MRRPGRALCYGAIGSLVVGLSLLALLAWVLRPPAPLPAPPRGLELARVTLVSRDSESWRRTPAMQLWPPHLRDGLRLTTGWLRS